jgi:hypothetical protein
VPERLTVVFDDPDLYRKLKVRAAEEGIAMKRIIEDALAQYLDGTRPAAVPRETTRFVDWDSWDAFQAELDSLPEEVTPDASDIKHQLYGAAPRELGAHGWRSASYELDERDPIPFRGVAEDSAPYDSR